MKIQMMFCLFNFQEMIAFQSDKSVEVRKFIIGFMEEARCVPVIAFSDMIFKSTELFMITL